MDATTHDSLITYADVAMNKAKSSGGARTVVRFTRDLLSYEHELEIEQQIRSALEENRVFFHLQPQFNIDHQLRGFEALARIKDKDGKFISPGEFIPIAEKTGLVSRIDSAVFRKAAAFFGDVLRKSGSDITLSVNISVQHMMKNNFIAGSLNFEEPDEETACINVVAKTQEAHFDMFLSNSFGFGGTNSTLIIKNY